MGAQPPTRLAILMADTPLPNTQAKYSTYGGVFTSLFSAALAPEPLAASLSLTYHNAVKDVASYPSLDSLDAILITGSKHSAFADDVWTLAMVDYVRKALATEGRVKVIGVCFGHQIVARAMGAPVVVNDKGWEVSVTDVELNKEGREFFGLESMQIQQMHRDIVPRLPVSDPPTILLASTETCPIQGFLYPGRAVTVQGHPEFTGEIVREILEIRHEAGIHPDDLFQSGIERVDNKHDGVPIARAFLRFLKS